MTILGELCCVALPFCCVVVVALPFSASLEVIVHVHVYVHVHENLVGPDRLLSDPWTALFQAY